MSELETNTPMPGVPQEAVITLYQTLGPDGDDGHALARRIWDLEAQGCQVLHLRINSTGGSVIHGYSLFSALRHTKMQVHTWLDGLALSMAGLIFLAGQERHVAPWGLLMLHNPSLILDPVEESAEEEGSQELLGRIRSSLLEMYASSSDLAPEELSAMMDAQTWLTASRCLELGLAQHLEGKRFPDLERKLDRLAASAPVHRLDPRALEALAAGVQSLADTLTEPDVPNPPGTTLTLPEALKRIEALQNMASFRDLEKQNPNLLLQLRRRNPAAFQALYERCYGQSD